MNSIEPKINELVIIAGVSCAGKTSLIDDILRGDNLHLCRDLGILEVDEWLFMGAGVAKNHIENKGVNKLLVHFDMFAHHNNTNHFAAASVLIQRSKDVKMVTIKIPNELLQNRLRSRIYKQATLLIKKPWRNRFVLAKVFLSIKKLVYYKLGADDRIYAHWVTFLQRFPDIRNWTLTNGKLESTSLEKVEIYIGDNTSLNRHPAYYSSVAIPVISASSKRARHIFSDN